MITFILVAAAVLSTVCYAVAYKIYRDLTRGIRRKRVRGHFTVEMMREKYGEHGDEVRDWSDGSTMSVNERAAWILNLSLARMAYE